MKVGVLLSGCGVSDGSEIHESVLTMLFLDRLGAETVLMAPNIDQMHVINHYTGQEMDEYRNVLVESARIARGSIKDMAEIQGDDLSALIIPEFLIWPSSIASSILSIATETTASLFPDQLPSPLNFLMCSKASDFSSSPKFKSFWIALIIFKSSSIAPFLSNAITITECSTRSGSTMYSGIVLTVNTSGHYVQLTNSIERFFNVFN